MPLGAAAFGSGVAGAITGAGVIAVAGDDACSDFSLSERTADEPLS